MKKSDIICDFPFELLIEFYNNQKINEIEGVLLVTKVENPSHFGVIQTKTNGLIESFIEKPKNPTSNLINAGIYLLNPKILDRIEIKPTSIEKDIFPQIVNEKKLYALGIFYYFIIII